MPDTVAEEAQLTTQLNAWALATDPVRLAPDRWQSVIEAARHAFDGTGSLSTVQGLLNSQFPEYTLRAEDVCAGVDHRVYTVSWALRAGESFLGDCTVAGPMGVATEGLISWGDNLAVGRFTATPAVIQHTYQGAGVFTITVADAFGGSGAPVTVTIVAPEAGE